VYRVCTALAEPVSGKSTRWVSQEGPSLPSVSLFHALPRSPCAPLLLPAWCPAEQRPPPQAPRVHASARSLPSNPNQRRSRREQGCHHAPGKRLLSATMRRRSCSCWLCSSGDGGPGGGARVRMVERERRAALRRCAASRSGGGGGCVLPRTTCTHHNNSPASSLQGGRSISTRPPAASLNCAALGWPGTRVCTPALCLPGQQPSHPARLANCRTLPGQDASSARPQSGMPPRRPTCCGARGGRALDQRAPRFAACSRVGEPFHWVAGRLRSTRVDHGHARDGMLWGWLWRRYEHPPVTERQARGCETDALPLMG
jgi:hypothetical protein